MLFLQHSASAGLPRMVGHTLCYSQRSLDQRKRPGNCPHSVPSIWAVPGCALMMVSHLSFPVRALTAWIPLQLFEILWEVKNCHLSVSHLCDVPKPWCREVAFPRAEARKSDHTGCGAWVSRANADHFLEPDIDPCEEALRKWFWFH